MTSLRSCTLLLLAATACVRPFVGRNAPPLSGPMTGGGNVGRSNGRDTVLNRLVPASKVVNGKEEPQTLIAIDGSRCTVTTAKFREVAYGDRVLCAWRDPNSGR